MAYNIKGVFLISIFSTLSLLFSGCQLFGQQAKTVNKAEQCEIKKDSRRLLEKFDY